METMGGRCQEAGSRRQVQGGGHRRRPGGSVKSTGRCSKVPNDGAGSLRKTEMLVPPFKVKPMLQIQGPFPSSLDPLSSLSVGAVYRRKMRQSNGSNDKIGRVTGHRRAESSESGHLCPRLVLPPQAV